MCSSDLRASVRSPGCCPTARRPPQRPCASKNVADCALLLEAIAGFDPRDATSVNRPVPRYRDALQAGLAGRTIGVPTEYFSAALDSDIEKAVRQGIAVLQDLGARMVDISPWGPPRVGRPAAGRDGRAAGPSPDTTVRRRRGCSPGTD